MDDHATQTVFERSMSALEAVTSVFMKILLVDDSAEMRQLLRRILEDPGVEFCECSDGDEASAAYDAQRPDWVLMDIRMKRKSGLTAASEIVGRFPSARVLMVTHYSSAQYHEAAHQCGAYGLVSKDDLFELRRLLSLS